MRADEIDEIRRKIKSLTSDNHERYQKSTTIPIRRSTVMNDELASVLPTIIDSTRGRSYIVQGSAESQTSNSRRNSNFNMTDSRRNSNTLQDFVKEIRRSIEYDDDDDENNNQIDTESFEDDIDIEEKNDIQKFGGSSKTLFLKQLKKMLYKSCSLGLKAGVLLLGHILLNIFKVLAFL
jgi:hypothetical protein